MNISKSRLKQIIKEELEIAEMETIFEEDESTKSDVVALMSSDQLTFSEKKQLMDYVSTFGVDRGLQKFKGYIDPINCLTSKGILNFFFFNSSKKKSNFLSTFLYSAIKDLYFKGHKFFFSLFHLDFISNSSK